MHSDYEYENCTTPEEGIKLFAEDWQEYSDKKVREERERWESSSSSSSSDSSTRPPAPVINVTEDYTNHNELCRKLDKILTNQKDLEKALMQSKSFKEVVTNLKKLKDERAERIRKRIEEEDRLNDLKVKRDIKEWKEQIAKEEAEAKAAEGQIPRKKKMSEKYKKLTIPQAIVKTIYEAGKYLLTGEDSTKRR